MDIKTAQSIMHPFSPITIKSTLLGIAERIQRNASKLGYDVELSECHDNEDNISMGLYMPDEVVLCYYKPTGAITFENSYIGEVEVTEKSIADLLKFYRRG
jgi:hypothetical protein